MSGWTNKQPPSPSAFIQWKGTSVCMDCYCVCGEHFHIDAEFAYYLKCPKCSRILQTPWYVELREVINERELAEIAAHGCIQEQERDDATPPQ